MKDGRPVHDYAVDDPDICAGCAAIARDMAEWQDDTRIRSLRFRLVKKT